MILRMMKALRRRWRAQRALSRARKDSLRRLQRGPVRRVLVVCYGNIYRSPFAAVSLRQQLPLDVEVRSSGFHRVAERASPERHVQMSREHGVELADHRSATLTAEDLQWADIVVFMDRHNYGRLDELDVPADKLLWLGAFGGGDVEILDPYELDDAHAQVVLRQLAAASQGLAAQIIEVNQRSGTGAS